MTSTRRLAWALVPCAALLGCPSSAPPEQAPPPPHQIHFELPAHGQMPACTVTLQAPDAQGLPPNVQGQVGWANAVYLAVRDCPEVRQRVMGGARLAIPVDVSPTGLALSTARFDPAQVYSQQEQDCLTQKLSAQPPEVSVGMTSALVTFIRPGKVEPDQP